MAMDMITGLCVIWGDCGVNNPCGQYGVCIALPNGQVECQCHEEWEGDFCNKQKIIAAAAGISTGVIIAIIVCLLILLCKFEQFGFRCMLSYVN